MHYNLTHFIRLSPKRENFTTKYEVVWYLICFKSILPDADLDKNCQICFHELLEKMLKLIDKFRQKWLRWWNEKYKLSKTKVKYKRSFLVKQTVFSQIMQFFWAADFRHSLSMQLQMSRWLEEGVGCWNDCCVAWKRDV